MGQIDTSNHNQISKILVWNCWR